MTRKPSRVRAKRSGSIPWLDTARRLFEVDGLSHGDVAAQVGVSRGRISQVVKEYAWSRAADRPADASAMQRGPAAKRENRKAASLVVAARAEAPTRRSPGRRPRPTPHSELDGGVEGNAGPKNSDSDVPAASEASPPPTATIAARVRPAAGTKPGPSIPPRKAEKAVVDARFRDLWAAGAPYADLRTAFGLVSDHAVLIKAVKLGLSARQSDKVPSTQRRGMRTQNSMTMLLERRRAAEERLSAASATSDVIASAKLYLQRKGVVVYAAAVVDGAAAHPDLLKVDGRAMDPQQMVAHAVKYGFDPENIAPQLRRAAPDTAAVMP